MGSSIIDSTCGVVPSAIGQSCVCAEHSSNHKLLHDQHSSGKTGSRTTMVFCWRTRPSCSMLKSATGLRGRMKFFLHATPGQAVTPVLLFEGYINDTQASTDRGGPPTSALRRGTGYSTEKRGGHPDSGLNQWKGLVKQFSSLFSPFPSEHLRGQDQKVILVD